MKTSPTERSLLFDTHVHFDPSATEGETQTILDRALTAGVGRMIAVGGSPEANRLAVDIARANPNQVRAAIGINRDQAETAWSADELAALISAPETVAIGEIGLDFHRAAPIREVQIRLFERMLEIARDAGLPVIVHSRAAEAETLAALEQHTRTWRGPKDRIGVQHCFTGSRAYADRLLALGFYIGFSGIITFMARGHAQSAASASFKKAVSLREIAAEIPEERLLIETDSPWLAPEPFRGQPNEPAYVRRVAETLAEIRHTSVEVVAAATFRNAEKIFGRFF